MLKKGIKNLSWNIISTDKYERRYKQYEKKHPNELKAILNNLDTYQKTLNLLNHPKLINAGFIHPEPKGIIAIDQKGGSQKVKLKQTRLYLYPDSENKIVHLLTIGDKNTQKEDILFCKNEVEKIRGGSHG